MSMSRRLTSQRGLSRRGFGKLVAAGACAAAVAASSTVVATQASAETGPSAAQSATTSRPLLRVPFHCNESWRGNAWTGHNPANAIDFNQGSGDSDLGKQVLASDAGTVVASSYVGSGYGERIIISHGGGWETLYAHLMSGSRRVAVGDHVAVNTVIGQVGKTGGQATSHLHYEQRQNGNDVPIKFGTSTWVNYPSETYYERIRDC